MKEFSNDPTSAMEEISSLFDMKVKVVQKKINTLKNGTASRVRHIF